MSVADTSQTQTDMAPSGSNQPKASRACAGRGKGRESRACILHIWSGIAMLAAGITLLIIT